MSFTSWLRNLRSAVAPGPLQGRRGRQRSFRASTHRPGLEVLEDRCLLSFSPAASYPTGPSPQAVVAADFDHGVELLELFEADRAAHFERPHVVARHHKPVGLEERIVEPSAAEQ